MTFVNFVMDNKLQDKVGTCKTSFKIYTGGRIIEPFFTMIIRESNFVVT